MKIKDMIMKAVLTVAAIAIIVLAMPIYSAEAGKKIIEDPETGLLVAVDDGEDEEEEKEDTLPTAKKIKKYEDWAKYFDMDTLVRSYWSDAKKAKNSLYDESKKYDGWMFVGSKSELKAACADKDVKYICVIPEYYSGGAIPKISGSKDKILVLPEGNWTNKSQWKEVWILDLWKYTEKASKNSIVLHQGHPVRGTDQSLLTVGKKVKGVNIGFAQKARDDMAKLTKSSEWSSILDYPGPSITVGASASVTIDAQGLPSIGTLSAGKKSKVTLTGNTIKITGSNKAKVTVKDCSYIGRAEIPITASDRSKGPEFDQGYAVGVSGKAYNYMELCAGGSVNASGYGLVLRVYENPAKTKIYCKNENELPFVQARFTSLPTEKTVRNYLPVIYIGEKKQDSMVAAPSDLKAMLEAFDTLGIKMSDSNAEKVRKLWRWGHAYCWHVNSTDFNKYTDDRDYFTQGVYDGFNAYGNLAGVFYFRNTGCNRINQAMRLALNWLGGVESYCVRDVPLNHAYNIVKLDDGKWYYVDFCPETHLELEIDVTKRPMDYYGYSERETPFGFRVTSTGEMICGGAARLWYEDGYGEDEYGSEPAGILFQDGDVMPDGRISDYLTMSVEERMISNSGFEFGTEYIGYTVAYKGGRWDGKSEKEPEIIGFSDLGGTKDYGKGYKAFFAMYDNWGLFSHYVDGDGNLYDYSFNPMTQREFELECEEAYGSDWKSEVSFHRGSEQG